MPTYHEHVLIATGKTDWTSRIENEEGVPLDLVRKLKARLGRGGAYANVRDSWYINVTIGKLMNGVSTAFPQRNGYGL